MIYPRKLFTTFIREIQSRRITVLTGMRQTGKTTLMRYVFDRIGEKNKIFLDLENPLNQKAFEEKNFDNILHNLRAFGFDPKRKGFVFLDEIQAMPVISRAIKYLHDHYQIKFFLTGSSSFYLKNIFPESMAGRKIIYELFPLDFQEFLAFKGNEKKFLEDFSGKSRNKNLVSWELHKKLYDEYLEYGGFPGVVIEEQKKKEVLEDIFKSFFEKDVKALADFKDISRLRDLIILLANRAGSKLEVSKVASEIGVSRETIYSYLSFLEKTYFIFLVAPFSRSLNGEVRGAKKVYLSDVGLLNYLGKISEGMLLENAIFQNLRIYGKVNYYEKYRGPEIDFILDGRVAFEVKLHGDTRDIKRLQKTAESLKIKESYLITKSYLEHPKVILALDV
ncbi:MAG: ATP-binding protein [Acidobacteriota bacterium]